MSKPMSTQIQGVKVSDRASLTFDRQFMGTGLMVVSIAGIDIDFGQVLQFINTGIDMS